ncbi:MAG: hypothetical protein IKF53_00355 [Clostridia bacterium]|nr:hypothetical protein [Clostridia bacterium]
MKKVTSVFLTVFIILSLFTCLSGLTVSAKNYSGSTINVEELKRGDTFTMGMYPQSRVTDSITLAALNRIDCTMKSYGYIQNADSSTHTYTPVDMSYADIVYNGEGYRKVIINECRPFFTYNSSEELGIDSQLEGTTENVCYFKWEPISWKVSPFKTGTMAVRAYSVLLLDSQPYNNFYEDTIEGKSTLFKWLNNDFYNWAFSENEKGKMDSNSSNNIVDLLSHYEVKKEYVPYDVPSGFIPETGFAEDDVADGARRAYGSDYAKSQGLMNNLRNDGYDRYSFWWLSDISYKNQKQARFVLHSGEACYAQNVNCIPVGVRPVLQLKEQAEISHSDSAIERIRQWCPHKKTKVIDEESTCTNPGIKGKIICAACETELSAGSISQAAKGHTMGEWRLKSEATSTQEGVEIRECLFCDYNETRNIAKKTQDKPKEPFLLYTTQSTIKVQGITDYEYSLNGKDWQKSSEFTGLTANTKYKIYQRIAENKEYYASESCEAISVTTMSKKAYNQLVRTPIVTDYTDNQVTLYAFDGYEYSRNGTTWQKSNKFTDLTPNTTYTFYQRVAQTDEFFASDYKTISQTTAKAGVNSNKYFDKLYSYLNSLPSKMITQKVTSGAYTRYYHLEIKGSGIYFNLVDSGNDVATDLGFTLYKGNRNIEVELLYQLYDNNAVVDSVRGSKTIDRSTVTINGTYSLYKSGKYITSSIFSNAFSSGFKGLITFWGNEFYKTQGFSLPELGFRNYSSYTCMVCDPATNYHYGNKVTRNTRSASCFVDGYTGDSYCETCGEKLNSGSKIASYGSHISGLKCGNKCTRCNEIAVHNYTAKKTPPTCTNNGYTTYTCSVCGDKHIDDFINAHGHNYTQVKISPTCTESGYETNTCTICGYEETNISAAGHKLIEKVDNKYLKTAATCTEKAVYYKSCSVCGEKSTETFLSGMALGHDYKQVTTSPTCTAKGYTVHTCTRCNISYKDTFIEATGHDYKQTITQPTCTEKGYTTHKCTRCDSSYKDTYVEELGHAWLETFEKDENAHWHKCTRCGNDSEHISHNFLEGLDKVCEDCGSYAVVKGKKAKPGETVTITVALKNAPETTSLSIGNLSYDKNNLTFVSAKWLPADSALKSWNKTNNNGVIGFENATDLNGDVLELTFNVNENAPEGEYTVSAESLYVENGKKVNLPTASGIVNVKNYIVGDTNGDEVITDQDAIYLLFNYYFPDKYPVEQPCDFNKDGEVTDQDAIYLLFHYYFPDKYPIE